MRTVPTTSGPRYWSGNSSMVDTCVAVYHGTHARRLGTAVLATVGRASALELVQEPV